MEYPIKFSIGIPAYKAKFFKECIDSILTQTYSNFELVILNDASPQDIENIVAGYDDQRIKYYRNDRNVGAEHVVHNWNKCLTLATGDYFVCMGDDDLLTPGYLQCFFDLITKHPDVDVFHCRTLIVDEYSIPYSVSPLCPEFENIYNYVTACIKGERQQFLGDFMYNRQALLDRGGYYLLPLGWCSDYLTSFIVAQNKGVRYTRNPVFKYRTTSLNITSTGNSENKRKAVIKYYNWIELFCQNNVAGEGIEQYEYEILTKTFCRIKKTEKVYFIRQYLGGKWYLFYKKIYCLIWEKQKLDIGMKDVFKAIIEYLFI